MGFPAIVSAKSPNAKLNLAIIGSGGRGGSNLANTAKTENVVALCDVNAQNLSRATTKYPKARTYRDFRQLYEKTGDIDAVVVSTTEHTHAFAVLPALQSKKHVYCEKPLTRDVYEARVITKAAKEAGVATQMGTQIHAGNNYRRVVEKIQSGAIGPVREVHVWVGRAWGWQSQEAAKRNGDIVWSFKTPKEAQTPPPHLDWDLWIGPAPRSDMVPLPKSHQRYHFGPGK